VGDTEGPLKSLRGFRRVDLKAGESRTVSIELSPDAFEFFDTSTNTMRVVPGEYEIMYGNSSDTPEANKLKFVLL
jgi:beta-glucosidase